MAKISGFESDFDSEFAQIERETEKFHSYLEEAKEKIEVSFTTLFQGRIQLKEQLSSEIETLTKVNEFLESQIQDFSSRLSHSP